LAGVFSGPIAQGQTGLVIIDCHHSLFILYRERFSDDGETFTGADTLEQQAIIFWVQSCGDQHIDPLD
jgi:hypothetical protein